VNDPPPLEVLVVDDELLIRWSLVETLSDAGHKVTEAGDRASALKAVRESARPPDVVLLDFRLPDSNDLGLLTAIRQIAPRAQIIMMTAFGTPEMASDALALGAYRVVNKPFEVRDLAALVVQAHAAPH
jgi:two-component system NtrC family response regulator/two-component system nitrogen regulation response regulator GlnG